VLALAVSAPAAEVPSPESVLGFRPGEDRKLADWSQIVDYFQKLAAASIHPAADFTEAYALADALSRELGLSSATVESKDPAFLDGRRGDMVVDGKGFGSFGEVHPMVLSAFELEHPVAALELDLRALPAPRGTRGTPSPAGP